MNHQGKTAGVPQNPQKRSVPWLSLFISALALIATGIQTYFNFSARNDAVESALRAEQLRACVAFHGTSLNFSARAQYLSEHTTVVGFDPEFDQQMLWYHHATTQLQYLLPRTDRTSVNLATERAVEVYRAFKSGDRASLTELAADGSGLDIAQANVYESCEHVIRQVRDN
jgi:hypothetical protein